MNGTKAIQKREIDEHTARGVCPLCTLLRHRQAQLVEQNGIPDAKRLCNYHAWSLARSAPADFAAEIFLHTLQAREATDPRAAKLGACDFCEALREDEEQKVRHLLEKLNDPAFLDWMRVHGTLCLWHAERIMGRLAPKTQAVVAELLVRTAEGLEQDLVKYAKGYHERRSHAESRTG